MALLTLSNRTNSFLQFMTVLIIFLFVVVITWFTTRWIAGFQKGRMAGMNIEVMETYKVAANKYIQIVRIGGRYLAIAVGKDEITMLTELNEEELNITISGTNEFPDFTTVLERVKKLKNKEK